MFDAETTAFLRDLEANNDRAWFGANRARYERVMKAPAAAFAEAFSGRLAVLFGAKTSARVFRVNRDLRFAKDRTPYNAHVHIAVTDGGSGMAWMFGLEPGRLVLGYGCFAFTGPQLARWREAVAGPEGAALAGLLESFRTGEPELRRVPAPFAQNHPGAALLRRKGLCVWLDDLPCDVAYGAEAPDRVTGRVARTAAVRDWLLRHV